METFVLEAEGIGKEYRLGGGQQHYGRLTESLWGTLKSPIGHVRTARRGSGGSQFWALRDVSFNVPAGQVLGIIGPNGAGKSTLLKIFSRITHPTEGTVRLRGRLGSLLEVGTGFHPELTGRENIFLNGTILGMRRKEIVGRFDEIVSFAGVEPFLDTPVKRYSSGMYVRLAFAVAAHLEPEILVIDEVLAVGDAAFQKKCLGKMGQVAAEGRTVLFVSHNMAAIEKLCSEGILLEGGRLVVQGAVRTVVAAYLEAVTESRPVALSERSDRKGNRKLCFLEMYAKLTCGSPGTITIRYEGIPPLDNVHISLGVFSLKGEGVLYLSNDLTNDLLGNLPAEGSLVCSFDKVPLLPGLYTVNIYCTVNGILADWIVDAGRLEVSEGDYFGSGRTPPSGYGNLMVSHEWEAGPV